MKHYFDQRYYPIKQIVIVHQCTRNIVVGSFARGALPLIEIQIGSPPNENGEGVFSMIVQR